MNKKIKIVGTFSALIISICMLTVGVLAASSVSLSVSSTVSFSASGVYASVSGSIWRGANESSLAQVTENANQTLAETKNFVEGQVSNGTFTGLENGWNPSEVEFSETNKIIEYRLTFKNYSEFNIQVIPLNNVSINGIISSQEITTGLETISPNESATYILRLSLQNVSKSSDAQIDIDFTIKQSQQEYSIKVEESYIAACTITVNEDSFSASSNVIINEGDYVRITSYSRNFDGVYIYNEDGSLAETLSERKDIGTWETIGWNSFPALEKGQYIYLSFPDISGADKAMELILYA